MRSPRRRHSSPECRLIGFVSDSICVCEALARGSSPTDRGLISGDPGDTGNLASAVVRHIELSLTVGLLHDGEKLPPEARLADQLSVSTITLRQALSSLRTRAVIETRRGRSGGSYIRDSVTVNAAHAEHTLSTRNSDEFRDRGDLSLAFVSRSSLFAALRATSSLDGKSGRRFRWADTEASSRCSIDLGAS